MIKRPLAILVLTLVYGVTKVVSVVAGIFPPSDRRRDRILINGTFHNPNWFFAHIGPLVDSGYGEVLLVCEPPVGNLPNLTLRHPPGWAGKLFSKAGARALWTLIEGICKPADVFVGYHIFPSAVTALICARLTGARAIYQVTAGELELEGGGWHAENKLLTMLGRPSSLVETMAHAIMREFDLIVVRGARACEYLRQHGYSAPIEIVTGSVDTNLTLPKTKDIDVALVGRLTEYKRVDRFVRVIALVVEQMGKCRAAIVGAGPDEQMLRRLAVEVGVEGHLEFMGQRSDVSEILGRTKVFVLTSRWEGVSIAMLEAMAMRAVPVVANVGDLADFVTNDVTGYLVPEGEISQYAAYIVELLKDDEKRTNLSTAARELVVERCDRQRLSERWRDILMRVVERQC